MAQASHQLRDASDRPVSSPIAAETLLLEGLTENLTRLGPFGALGLGWSIRKLLSWRGQLSCLLLTVK